MIVELERETREKLEQEAEKKGIPVENLARAILDEWVLRNYYREGQ